MYDEKKDLKEKTESSPMKSSQEKEVTGLQVGKEKEMEVPATK